MRFVDCHVHLMDYPRPASILELASTQGMKLFSVSRNVKTAKAGLEQGKRFRKSVKSFVGIHPSDAMVEEEHEEIATLLEGAAGIGEIGLDPFYSEVSRKSRQMELFVHQIKLAERSRKPVQVHTRNAEKTCLEILGSYELPRVLLHWFEGETLLGEAAGRGYYASVGPALLYSKKVTRIVQAYPIDLLLTESDGPVGFKAIDGAGGPYTVPSVVFRLCEILKQDYFELSARLVRNAESYLQVTKG